MLDPSCVFCRRIAHREYDDTPVLGVVSFTPLNPVVPGHRLFVPMAHVSSAAESPGHAAMAVKAASLFAKEVGSQDYNIITSIGKSATQTVLHLHVHLVPRVDGDGLSLPWTGQIIEK